MITNMFYWVLCVFLFLQHEAEWKIVPTADRNVSRVIYKADFDWDVELKLINEKGRKKLSRNIERSTGFLLPSIWKGEPQVNTQSWFPHLLYDVSWELWLCSCRWLAKTNITYWIQVLTEYKSYRQSITVSSDEALQEEVNVSVCNNENQVLVSDKIPISESTIYRIYNLAGAPENRITVRVYTSKHNLIDQSLDFWSCSYFFGAYKKPNASAPCFVCVWWWT